VGPGFVHAAEWIGLLLLGAVVAIAYRWVSRQSQA
jgi:hypothetical protein